MTRTPFLLIPLVALGLAAAGCGGGGDSNSQGGFQTTTSTVTTEATTEAATTEAATTEATTTTSGVASAKDCRALATLGQKFSAAFTGAASSQDLKTEASLLKELAAKTPADIRGAFETLAGYMKKLADLDIKLKPGETPDPATLAKLQKLATQIDQAKLAQASSEIAQWVSKNCSGIGTSGSKGG